MGSFYDNDEAPSIFDIAMAYENGNGGIIRPKKKDGIYGTYQTLSDDEKNALVRKAMQNPSLLSKLKELL